MNNNNLSKFFTTIVYIFIVLIVLGFAIVAINSIASDDSSSSSSVTSSGSSDETATQYTITWSDGTIPDGYSFEYECPESAAEGETVTISIYDTVTTITGTSNIYFTVKDTDSSTQYISSGAKVFQSSTWSFTMPAYNVTITYTITKPSESVV